MGYPVVRGVAYVLAHVPDLVRYGSKPEREIPKNPDLLSEIQDHLRDFSEARNYPPHQVFIGNMEPEELWEREQPWYENLISGAPRSGEWGEIYTEKEFYGWLKVADEFDLIYLTEEAAEEIETILSEHHLARPEHLEQLGDGVSRERVKELISGGALALEAEGELMGCIVDGHDEDENLTADILLENLSTKASGFLAVEKLMENIDLEREDIAFVINSGEEGVGDRYQRGAGNLAKAIAEMNGLSSSTGADVKAFCCAPMHASIVAGSLIESGVFDNVILVGGGSLAKLGMKMQGHLSKDMPIMEDVLAGNAFLFSKDDEVNPQIRLDTIGKHDVAMASSQQAIYSALVDKPLQKVGLTIFDVDKYSSELHNPEITVPAGSGNVPHNNYRMIGSFAVKHGLMEADELDEFEKEYGMPGFSPTQGHIPSALPFLGFARDRILKGEMKRTFFLGKGSLFLAKMSNISDGMSFILEANSASSSQD